MSHQLSENHCMQMHYESVIICLSYDRLNTLKFRNYFSTKVSGDKNVNQKNSDITFSCIEQKHLSIWDPSKSCEIYFAALNATVAFWAIENPDKSCRHHFKKHCQLSNGIKYFFRCFENLNLVLHSRKCSKMVYKSENSNRFEISSRP